MQFLRWNCETIFNFPPSFVFYRWSLLCCLSTRLHNQCTDRSTKFTISLEIELASHTKRKDLSDWSETSFALLSRCGTVEGIYWFNLKIERRSLVLFHFVNVYFPLLLSRLHTSWLLFSCWKIYLVYEIFLLFHVILVLLHLMMWKMLDFMIHKRLVFDDF